MMLTVTRLAAGRGAVGCLSVRARAAVGPSLARPAGRSLAWLLLRRVLKQLDGRQLRVADFAERREVDVGRHVLVVGRRLCGRNEHVD